MRASAVVAVLLVAVTAGCARASVHHAAALSPSLTPSPTPVATTTARPSATRHATASPSRTHTVTPHRVVTTIPPVSAKARADGLIDIRTIVPDAIVDMRYATSHNFTGVRLYPVDARCLVHQTMAPGLVTAAARLRSEGYRLVFWDCYRPHAVQVHMFQIVPNPNWVARPGPYARSHEAARSVDVSLAHAKPVPGCPAARLVQQHCLLDMGTGFDDFTPRAYAYATDGVSPQAQANRALLRRALYAGGITVYDGEWWHFDGPGALVGRPQLDAPVD